MSLQSSLTKVAANLRPQEQAQQQLNARNQRLKDNAAIRRGYTSSQEWEANEGTASRGKNGWENDGYGAQRAQQQEQARLQQWSKQNHVAQGVDAGALHDAYIGSLSGDAAAKQKYQEMKQQNDAAYEQQRFKAFQDKLARQGKQGPKTIEEYRQYKQWASTQQKGKAGFGRWQSQAGTPAPEPAQAPQPPTAPSQPSAPTTPQTAPTGQPAAANPPAPSSVQQQPATAPRATVPSQKRQQQAPTRPQPRTRPTAARPANTANQFLQNGGAATPEMIQTWNEQAATQLANMRQTHGYTYDPGQLERYNDIVQNNPHIKDQHKQAWSNYVDEVNTHRQNMAGVRQQAQARRAQPPRRMIQERTPAGTVINKYASYAPTAIFGSVIQSWLG